MHEVFILIALGLVGVTFGSFAGATVWRLRASQLRQDEAAGEKVSKRAKKEVGHVKKASVATDRSVCLHCGHQLAWYDLLPLFSWLQLGGKCRYCHKPIGWLEPSIEIGMALFFVVAYLFWPLPLDTGLDVVRLALWLITGVGLGILTVYDAKWFLLPNRVVFTLIGIGIINSLVVLTQHNFGLDTWMNILYSYAILSGLYYIIYIVSNRQWIGFGDVKLGIVLALMLADWRLALLSLFLANLIGAVVILPLLLSGRVQRQAHIPFGPFLIAGWFFAGLFGNQIITWYLSLTLGL